MNLFDLNNGTKNAFISEMSAGAKGGLVGDTNE